ncbi:NACHT, LRR and PYD domains-containing protein 8 [Choloepus didactylus]|uniref:NACHT, LRR and PYD domains-containing protein 8 n=1 Tax=Choloepus didactylus TaxID=27675 RepID=UPI00189D7803|nr:NACHT, LRR and PYD domains-containing protein 8 [Choloepus didactylus]
MSDGNLNSDLSSSSPTSSASPSLFPSPFTSPCAQAVIQYITYLSEAELQTFKDLLVRENPRPDSVQLTSEQLKAASYGEVVHLLMEYFPGRLAWDLTHKLFAKMDKSALCLRLQMEMKGIPFDSPPEDLSPRKIQMDMKKEESDKIQEYKLDVMSKYSTRWNRAAWPESHMDFIYQDVHRDEKCIPLLFLPQKPQCRQPKTVVLQGYAGIGKTTLAKKVMLAWAENKFYSHKFWYAFHFHCQEVIQGAEHSFCELIVQKWPGSQALLSKIMSKPDHILLLFDGFEELTSTLEERQAELSGNWSQKLPGSILLGSLLSKRMLPEAALLIVMRFASLEKLKPLLKCPFSVTLKGFSTDEKIEYFNKYFRSHREVDKALRVVMGDRMFFSMCRTPVVCWIVCSVLKQLMERGADLRETCPNSTAVFIWYLSSLFPTRAGDPHKQTFQEQLNAVCHLAAKGMWDMRWVFDKKDLEQSKLDETGVATLISVNILQRAGDNEDRYTFAHLSFQEFFAALLYVLCYPQRFQTFQALDHGDIKRLIANPEGSKNYLSQMGLFLFGLLNDMRALAVEQALGCKLTTGNKKKLLNSITQVHEWDPLPPCCAVPQLFYYLHEIQEEAFVRQALKDYYKATLKIKKKIDMQVSAFCLRHCQHLQEMKLSIRGERFNTESFSSPRLEDNVRLFLWWQDFCSVFWTNEGLEDLAMTNSVLEPAFVKVLSTALTRPQCKLQKLRFRSVNPPMLSEDLIRVLTDNQFLRYLEISHTKVESETMRLLCSALKHPQCHLQCLRLEDFPVTPEHCCKIAWALKDNVHLKTLLLRRSSPQDLGAYYLFMALQQPECRLERLSLENCGLTESSCKSLAPSLRSSKMLTHLSLAENSLKDEGVKMLWEALKHSECPLQRLVLRKCALTSACCQDVASALNKNKNLRSLDLGFNSLKDDGVILLCEALMSPRCALQTLELETCQLTSTCCQAVAAMLLHNQSLRYLDLTKNGIGSSGIQLLCGAFRDRKQRAKISLTSDPKERETEGGKREMGRGRERAQSRATDFHYLILKVTSRHFCLVLLVTHTSPDSVREGTTPGSDSRRLGSPEAPPTPMKFGNHRRRRCYRTGLPSRTGTIPEAGGQNDNQRCLREPGILDDDEDCGVARVK